MQHLQETGNHDGMKKKILLLHLLFICLGSYAQQKGWTVSVGVSPVHSQLPAAGTGISIARDFNRQKKLGLVVEAGFLHFGGKVINPFLHDTAAHLNFVPLLGGLHYRINKKIFAGLQAGMLCKAGKNIGTLPLIRPEAGVVVFPLKKAVIDMAVQWYLVSGLPSIPENSFLKKGGYDFVQFRIGCRF